MSKEEYIRNRLDMINRNSVYGMMKKVCEDCTHNRYCEGEYLDEKGCFYKHYYNKDGKYVMPAEEKEEKEMNIMFDYYIKNVAAIDVEMLPDDSQVKIQVRSGEDIYLFLLEGKGVKIAADKFVELKAENFRLYKEIDQLKKERDELKAVINDVRASNKELERIHENFIKKNKYLIDKLAVKDAAYQTLKKEFNDLSKSLGGKNCQQCCDEYTRLEKENHELALKMRNQSKEIDKLEKRNKYLNQQIDEMVLNANNKENTDEEPHSRRDILRCAEKCVCGKREQDYGTPESNFSLIADLWNDYLKKEKSSVVVDALDVAMMMALLKIARIRNGGGTGDSFVDLAGYAACGGEINAQKKAAEAN